MALEQSCRIRKHVENEPLVAKFRFDTAENDLSELDILDNFGDFDYVVLSNEFISANVGRITTWSRMRRTKPELGTGTA